MMKKMLVMVCLVAVLMGLAVAPATVGAETQSYQVGYSIKDMNPWVDVNDHSKGVLGMQLTGNGNDDERACTGMMDDNDDGTVGDGDGLHTTCTAVTDPYGNTVMYITIDSLQGYGVITKDVRESIVEVLGSGVITADRIMVNGSHSHSSCYFAGLKSSTNEAYKAYYQYVIDQITAAAVEAYGDRAAAVMTKGSIDAKESTAHLGYNNGEGYHMNAIRHYDMEISNGKQNIQFVGGSNFGRTAAKIGTTLNLSGLSGYKVTANGNAVESDNTMHVLQFAFEKGSGKEPILLVNWRAHTTNNSGGDNKTKLSSDYVNSLRTNLKKKGFRAAFIQGAAGNVVMNSVSNADWSAETGKKDSNVYGRILANVAEDCVKRMMSDPLPVGEIRTLQHFYNGHVQLDGEGLQAAAAQYKADTAELQKQEGNENNFPTVPYKYVHTDGKTYILNSKFHANIIQTRQSNANSKAYLELELNAIMLGDSVAFVTAPNEIVDRYDAAGSRKDKDNDWLELVDDATYGTPFVMGYTNEGKGYIPNSLDYTYNTDEYYEVTGWGAEGDSYFGAGSYEANISRFARGTGEDIVQRFKWMLNIVGDGYYTAKCEACDKMVKWTPLTSGDAAKTSLGTGHYYLAEDLPMGAVAKNQKTISNGETLCLDLNGHKSEVKGRSFIVQAGGVLNIMDSRGGGKIISYTGNNNVGGGVASVSGTMSVYGGTLQFVRTEPVTNGHATGAGGIALISGVVNIYGGTMIGGDMEMSAWTNDSGNTLATNGCGGAFAVNGGGLLNIEGGRIIAGAAADGGKGDCIYMHATTSRVKLSGDAVVDEIFYNNLNSAGQQLTVSGDYTGSVSLRFDSDVTFANKAVGVSESANLAGSRISCYNGDEYDVTVSDNSLKITTAETKSAATVYGPSGAQYYDSLSAALNNYTSGRIKLLKDETSTVSVNKTAYIDMNGFDIAGVTVAEGCTLYGMDSLTDDYDVEDGEGYGTIGSVSGKLEGVPAEWTGANDGYVMIQENGKTSFHRVNLQIYAMTLRPDEAGLYYNSTFAGDEVIARNVIDFGVALSVLGVPDEGNVNEIAKCSEFENFKAGEGANADASTGTLLMGVMKEGNNRLMNARNAELPVYGRAYIRTAEGYTFGQYQVRSFREQIEDIDAMWDTLTQTQKDGVVKLYESFAITMRKWNIPRIIANSKIGTNITDIPFDSLI